MKTIKRMICYIICTVLILSSEVNVYAASDVEVLFNFENGAIVDFNETSETILTVEANSDEVTDFDVYINDEFYETLWGNPIDIDLEELDVLGLIEISVKANGESEVLAESQIDVFLKDAYIFASDMSDAVEGENLPGSSVSIIGGGSVVPEVIDEAYGKSLVLGANDTTLKRLFYSLDNGITKTDRTSAVLEFDARYTNEIRTVHLVLAGLNEDAVTKELWKWPISSVKPNGSALQVGEWYHFKYIFETDADNNICKYSVIVDGNTVSNNVSIASSELDCITKVYFSLDPPSTDAGYEFILDNVEFYEGDVNPAIVEVTDSYGMSGAVNYES